MSNVKMDHNFQVLMMQANSHKVWAPEPACTYMPREHRMHMLGSTDAGHISVQNVAVHAEKCIDSALFWWTSSKTSASDTEYNIGQSNSMIHDSYGSNML